MKNHVVLIIVLFLLVLVTANCTSSNNSELLYIDEKGIIHIEIEKILDEFKVDNKKIPFAFLRYRGKSKTYITYMEIENNPLLCGDDAPIYSASSFDFDIYSDGNYLTIVSELKKVMLENGFIWIEDSIDMYEEDTGLYHKTITFAKERRI